MKAKLSKGYLNIYPLFFSVVHGEERCQLPCQMPCPDDTIKCEVPEDGPKTKDGCPMPLLSICATDATECPTKENLNDCPKQPECSSAEQLCFPPSPPRPATGAPACPLVGNCLPKDSTDSLQ